MDTLSLAWRPREETVFDTFRGLPHRFGPAGSWILDERGPGGERLIMFPAYGVLSLEGRLGAMLAGDESNHDLVGAARLPDAETSGQRALQGLLGYRPDAQTVCEVRRYDLASDLRFEDGADGLAMLGYLAGMCPPGAKLDTIKGADGIVQTVAVRSPKRMVISQRFYDKGVESGTAAPGEWIRAEAQLRPPKSKRFAPATLGRLDLRSQFIGRMAPYVNGNEETVVAGTAAAVDHLMTKAAREELSLAKAERMIGSLVVLGEHGRGIYGERQGQRRLADLRDAGVSLEHALPPDRVVPVGELLRQAMEDFGA